MDFPTRAPEHVSESSSLKIVRNSLPALWVVRDISERDYGIDLYVEMVHHDAKLRGNMLALQVKSKKKVVFSNAEHQLSGIKRSTINYWLSLPVPVFVCLACISTGKCFWANVERLNREGKFVGTSKTLTISFMQGNEFSPSKLTFFEHQYVLEKHWTRIDQVSEKSLMLFNTLGPLVLMCKRSASDEACTTTVQYLMNQHYENYTLMAKYILWKRPKDLQYWYERNAAYSKSALLEPSFTFYYSVMTEMLDAFLRDYRDCLIEAYELVTVKHAHHYSKRFSHLYIHLKNRPHTFVADDWYARYYFDGY